MIATPSALVAGQVVMTGARRNDTRWPVDLAVACTVSGNASSARQVRINLHGAIGPGSGVRLKVDRGPNNFIEVAGKRATVSLNSADDHTQNQIFSESVVRADGREMLATLSISYPAAMPRPAGFDNSVPIGSAGLELTDLKSYRTVLMGDDQLHVPKIKNPPVYLRGPCVLSPMPNGATQ